MSTALYRRYRPETFADVIGQEHVTEPLITALTNNRVNHAYLFSGPRGCGKTTSARILARCLNCAQGPTPTPCGSCDSCIELSRDGGGSLDVIEMDAASHGGVDHARDLRERATFAPVRDRYKIFIIDEAHMVTREGFNALLKIVEEPPEHIKFIFATTEPNKVLGTIRSRTHHYPFRLVPPETLHAYLLKLCTEEGVSVEDGVLQLVVRAGGGSVRDSLSILDQLMAGSGETITYDLAVALLGFTHGELLDEVISAFATGNSAQVFGVIDRVIQTGQDPRRFVEDLLERFRDLIIVQAAPDAAQSILRGVSADQLTRLREQAALFGSAELSRAADITNQALNEMSGATSPQLHLELLCARILLPASDKSMGGMGARLDRIERRFSQGEPAGSDAGMGTSAPLNSQLSGMDAVRAARSNPAQPNPVPTSPLPAAAPLHQAGSASAPLAAGVPPLAGLPVQASSPAQAAPQAPAQVQAPSQVSAPQPSPLEAVPTQPASAQVAPAQPVSTQPVSGENTVLMVRNAWREVLGLIQSPTARNWFAQCQPVKFEKGALYIRADIDTLRRVKPHVQELKAALYQVLGLSIEVHGDVAKKAVDSLPQPQQQMRPPIVQQPAPAQSTYAQPSPDYELEQAPIAEGPRGGEQAWRAHGQPLTQETPDWSADDWNNPVTSWDVAAIPSSEPAPESESAPEPESATEPSHTPVSQAQPNFEHISPVQSDPAPLEPPVVAEAELAQEPSTETGPMLRVIQGEAQEARVHIQSPRDSHPSTGKWRRADIAPVHDAEFDDSDVNAAEPEETEYTPVDSEPAAPADAGSADAASAQVETAVVAPQPPLSAPESAPETAPDNQSLTRQEQLAEPGLSQPVEPQPAAAQAAKGGFRERFAAQLDAGHRAAEEAAQRNAPAKDSSSEPEDFTESEEDEALEASVLIGQRAVEKVLGGILIDEQPLS